MYINYRTTIAQGLIALFFLFAPLQAAYSFTFTVDDPSDFPDVTPGDGVCDISGNICTLRAAIQEANAWPGMDYIVLPAETYLIERIGANENASATGDYDISDDLTINGAGAATTIIDGGRETAGAPDDRVFHILSGATVTISGVTITHGSSDGGGGGGVLNEGVLTILDSTIKENTTTGRGGGISNIGTLTVERCHIIDHPRPVPGQSERGASSGGGISNGGIGGTDPSTTINETLINNNVVSGSGGGVEIFQGTVTINNSIISSNLASSQQGGGIVNQNILIVNNSTISGNGAQQGGGYSNFGAASTAAFTNSTISNNNASNVGGGIINRAAVTLTNTTVTRNTSTAAGDGIYSDNTGSTGDISSITLRQSMIADNDPGSGVNCGVGRGQIISQGYNLDTDASCSLGGTGDISSGSSGLDPAGLSYNGGPTRTFKIQSSASDAVDAGDNSDCPATDQRGLQRPVDGNSPADGTATCDIGAFEYTSATYVDLKLNIEDTPDPFRSGIGNLLTYTMTVTNQGPANATGVTLTNTLPASVSYDSGTAGCAEAAGTVTCNIGALNVNSGTTINIVVADTPATVGTITSTATAAAIQLDLNTANDTNITETTLVITTTDLGVTKVMTVPVSEPVLVTQNITYQVTVTNNGPNAASGIRLIDTLPAGATLVSATGASWTCTGTTTITCDLSGTLAASGTSIVEIVMTPPVAGGTITNTANVTFDGIDTISSNNISSLDTDTLAVTDILVDITESSDPVLVGADFTYQFNVTNNGPSAAANVELTVTLPATLTLNATGGSTGWSCSGTTTVICNLSSLAADTNSVVIFTVNPAVAAPSGNPVIITADIISDAFDTNTANNSATEQTVVNAATTTMDDADITLVSLFDNPNPVTEGNNLIYTATIRNNGPDTARNVVLTLLLPGSVTLVSSDAACTAQTIGSTLQITCPIGSMVLDGTTAAHITVTPTVGGVIITASASVTNSTGDDPNVASNNNNKTQSTQVIAATGTTPPSPGTASGGGCFIATAAYGSYLDPHVMVLRKFRDNYLLTNGPGTRLVDFYYATSPPIADFIRQHEALRAMTRWALTPIVFGIEYPLGTVMFGLLLMGGINYHRMKALS